MKLSDAKRVDEVMDNIFFFIYPVSDFVFYVLIMQQPSIEFYSNV